MNELDIGEVIFKVIANAQMEVPSGDLLIINYSTVVRSTVKSTDMRIRHMPVVTPRSQISSF